MDRRDFVQSRGVLVVAGCGYTEVDDMPQEFTLSPSPIRTGNQVNAMVPGYSEGLWTPQLSFGTNSVGITYGIQRGDWIKIGRSCLVNVLIVLTSKGSSTGAARIVTLPFKLPNVTGGAISTVGSAAWFLMTSTLVNVTPIIQGNDERIELFGLTVAGTELIALTHADFSDTTDLNVSIFYRIGE